MINRRCLLLACLTIASAAPARAADDETITRLVRELYDSASIRDAEPFTPRLLALHEAAVARSMELNEPVSGLDFDYVINGQDYSEDTFTSARFEIVSNSDTEAEVKVTFNNGGPQELRYTVVAGEQGLWWIDEVRSLTPGYEWTLSELLAEGAK
ncbi:MAG: YbjP/YqhG family protein [Rhizobiaceae bacterium]|jgi:hypothetical protein|nr:YbjP/YqhG family protein [Rhizobiaceae bacterium]